MVRRYVQIAFAYAYPPLALTATSRVFHEFIVADMGQQPLFRSNGLDITGCDFVLSLLDPERILVSASLLDPVSP